MTEYIATFFTHFSAMQTQKALAAQGVDARMEPVPRALSASCGVCVRYRAQADCSGAFHRDWEGLYRRAGDAYEVVKRNAAL